MKDNNTNTSQPAPKQVGEIARERNGQFTPGQSGNPTGVGGFGDNPENRANGSWKKTDTARFKLERMMEMHEGELNEIISDPYRPMFEHKLAKAIIDGQWTVIKEMMQEVYGRKTDIDMNLKAEEGVPIIKGFVIPTAPEDFIDADGKQKEQQYAPGDIFAGRSGDQGAQNHGVLQMVG